MKKKDPYHDESMWKGASPEIFRHAEYLRNNPTEAETKLWEQLQRHPFNRYHFRRQHPIHKFIADFYSHKLRLIVEIDGRYHETEQQQEKDRSRSELLKFQKLEILRFTNQQVLQNMEAVLNILSNKIYSSPFSGSL